MLFLFLFIPARNKIPANLPRRPPTSALFSVFFIVFRGLRFPLLALGTKNLPPLALSKKKRRLFDRNMSAAWLVGVKSAHQAANRKRDVSANYVSFLTHSTPKRNMKKRFSKKTLFFLNYDGNFAAFFFPAFFHFCSPVQKKQSPNGDPLIKV